MTRLRAVYEHSLSFLSPGRRTKRARMRTRVTENAVDMFEELQALDAGQLETVQIETRPVRFAEGDVVALKHKWKRYLEPFSGRRVTRFVL